MDPVPVGLLGCGTISDAYLRADDRFDAYDVVACADLELERARAKADEYGIRATDVDGLLADDAVELVVNLTPPAVHAETCEQALAAGKHVYVEKPLAASVDDAQVILRLADEARRLVGSAPDTFLGAGLQTARSVVDDGRLGDAVGATAVYVSGGHEGWHPNPELYYGPGGGPLFDMGSYYVTALVFLLGPAVRVTGSVSRTFDERTIGSGRRQGERIDVEVPTHEAATIDFADGTVASLQLSFDVPAESTLPPPVFELYGTEATLALPDPNRFDGPVRLKGVGESAPDPVPLTHDYTAGRGIGVADLASAIRTDWSPRTEAALARHVLEILAAVREASETGGHVALETTVDRPDPLPPAFPVELES